MGGSLPPTSQGLLIIVETGHHCPASRGEVDGFRDLPGNARDVPFRISAGFPQACRRAPKPPNILPAETPTIHQSSARHTAMQELERSLPVSKGELQSLGSWQTLIPAANAAARCSTTPPKLFGRCRFNSANASSSRCNTARSVRYFRRSEDKPDRLPARVSSRSSRPVKSFMSRQPGRYT
jgi:hypothetical protein